MGLSPMRNITREKTVRRRRKLRRVWKLKVKITWKAIKKSLLNAMKTVKQLSTVTVRSHQQVPIANPNRLPADTKKNDGSNSSTKSLAQLLIMPYRASDFIDLGDNMTPTKSPMVDISTTWREIHGIHNWDGLLDPLHPWLRREISKYGEFVEATYDAFDFDPLSEYCGSSRYNRHKIFEELGLNGHGYKVTKYIYAMSHVDVPKWFAQSRLGSVWSKDSNWMGYIAVSTNKESERIGRRDIVVVWRGTVAPTEWFIDLKAKLHHFGSKRIKVQHGFLSIYMSKSEHTRYNKLSASEQVMEELNRLVNFFLERGEEVSLTVTGHSLGGALALLNAYEAATSFSNNNKKVFVSVISFGAPRVGNVAFKERLNELGVKTLRVVVKQDLVPKLPGIVINDILHKLNAITIFSGVYRHVGIQLKLDASISPYLKRDRDLSGCHNLEIYLHLLDGFSSKNSKFRWEARRDLALVNKTSDMLIEELKIPEFWYQLPHKGLVLNKHGRWVKPGRQPEDIPSPVPIQLSNQFICN